MNRSVKLLALVLGVSLVPVLGCGSGDEPGTEAVTFDPSSIVSVPDADREAMIASGDSSVVLDDRVFNAQAADDDVFSTPQELMDFSNSVVVVTVDGLARIAETGDGDSLIDTAIVDATIVQRVSGASGLPDRISLASVFLEDGPDPRVDPPHRVDEEVWRGDREFLVFLQPFRYRLEVWPDTYVITGGLQGIFSRPISSGESFEPLVPAESAVASAPDVSEVAALRPGRAPSPDDE